MIKQNTPNQPAWLQDPWGMGSIMDVAVEEVLTMKAKDKEQADEIINKYRLSSGLIFATELRKRVRESMKNANR